MISRSQTLLRFFVWVACTSIISGCLTYNVLADEGRLEESRIITDFRQTHPSPPAHPLKKLEETKILEAVLGEGVPDTYSINGVLQGSFTEAEKTQVLYLLAKGEPVADSPQAIPPVLALYEDGKLVTQFVPGDASYRQFAGGVDIDGDGMTEVLLQVDYYHMGTHVTTVDLYHFKQGQRTKIKSFEAVYENTCDAPLTDEKVRASTLELVPATKKSEGRIIRKDFVAVCPQSGSDKDKLNFQLETVE